MNISLIAVGTRMPNWVETAFSEYAKRMPPICKLSLVEIPAGKRGKNADIPRILRDEITRVCHQGGGRSRLQRWAAVEVRIRSPVVAGHVLACPRGCGGRRRPIASFRI